MAVAEFEVEMGMARGRLLASASCFLRDSICLSLAARALLAVASVEAIAASLSSAYRRSEGRVALVFDRHAGFVFVCRLLSYLLPLLLSDLVEAAASVERVA
jgi:hypothetical protein